MNFSKHKIVLFLTITTVVIDADDVVSEESKNGRSQRHDRNTYNAHDSRRRFYEDLDDAEWHVAHLRDTDFGTRRGNCKEETTEERMKRYRKSLENDGSLVEYVSADPLPVNVKDLVPDVCRIPEGIQRIFKPIEEGRNTSKTDEKSTNGAKANEKEKMDTATTYSDKPKEKEPKGSAKRRTNDYMFSSDEYYDETVEFDEGSCPDDVIVVTLEMDHIRNYDVQCQLLLTWRKLE